MGKQDVENKKSTGELCDGVMGGVALGLHLLPSGERAALGLRCLPSGERAAIGLRAVERQQWIITVHRFHDDHHGGAPGLSLAAFGLLRSPSGGIAALGFERWL